MNLGKQVISAGAESVGIFCELATIAAAQRSQMREVMQASCEIQGQATLADGAAQQKALYDEADIRGTQSVQSFIEAGATFGNEIVGVMAEGAANKFNGATKSQTNLSHAEAFEAKFSGSSSQKVVVRKETPGAAIEMQPVSSKKMDVSAQSNATQTKDQHFDEEKLKDLPLSLKKENGDMKDLEKDFTPEEKKALEYAVAHPDSEKSIALRKQAKKAVKFFQSQVDSKSAKSTRVGNFSKDIVRAGNLTAKGYLDAMDIKQTQQAEADQKLRESQAKYLSDTNGSLMRQSGDVASNLTNHIQNINQARKEMFESNRA